jgi:hypothetical protein
VDETSKQSESRTAHLRPYQWKPGQSGNPAGRPKGAVSIVRLMRNVLEENGEEAARKIALAIIEKAKAGDPKCAEIVLDRIDGKVTQGLEVEGGGITFIFEDRAKGAEDDDGSDGG